MAIEGVKTKSCFTKISTEHREQKREGSVSGLEGGDLQVLNMEIREPCVNWGWLCSNPHSWPHMTTCHELGQKKRKSAQLTWEPKETTPTFPKHFLPGSPGNVCGAVWEFEGRTGAPALSATLSWEVWNADCWLDTVFNPKLVGLGHMAYISSMWIACLLGWWVLHLFVSWSSSFFYAKTTLASSYKTLQIVVWISSLYLSLFFF